MAPASLSCLSSDCPAVPVNRKLWQWRINDGEQQVATWLHYLVFDPENKIMAQAQLGFPGSPSQQQTVKNIKDSLYKEALSRSMICLLTSDVSWLIPQLGFSTKST